MSRRINPITLLVALLAPPASWVRAGRVPAGLGVYLAGVASAGFCLGLSFDVPRAELAGFGIVLTMFLGALGVTVRGTQARNLLCNVVSTVMVFTFWPALVVAAFALSPLALYRVPSKSMEPTIEPGDLLVLDTWAYTRTVPERGDIVIFEAPGSEPHDYVKRVVGLPGESLRVVEHRVMINGRPVDRARLQIDPVDPTLLELPNVGPLTVPPGHLFVMGDHRTRSVDSRNFGVVPFPIVRGRVLWLVWPWPRVAALSPFRSE